MTTGWSSLEVRVAWDDDPLTWAPTWSSIKDDVTDITIARGGRPPVDRYDAGTADISLDDDAGDYNVANTAGAHYGKLRSYKQLQVLINDSTSTQRSLFRGHVKPRGWSNQPQLPSTSLATVSAADILQMAGRAPVVGSVTTPTYLDDLLDALMSAVGLSTDWYTFLGGTEHGVLIGLNDYDDKLLSYLQLLAISDGGAVFADKDGVLSLEQRLFVWSDSTRNSVQQVFADDGSGIPFEFDGITPDYAYDPVTSARRTGVSGIAQTVTSGSSSSITGLDNLDDEATVSLADPEAYSRAELRLALRETESFGPTSITFEATESDDALDALATLDLRQRVELRYTPPGLAQQTTDHFIEGIGIKAPIEASPNTIKVTLDLSPAAPLDALNGPQFLILDSATLGKLDTGLLGF